MPSKNKTENLQLNAWEGNEYVKRIDFVEDNTKIDKAYADLKGKVDNISLIDSKVAVTDLKGKFTGTTLDKVLDEVDDKIIATSNKVDNIELTAPKLVALSV